MFSYEKQDDRRRNECLGKSLCIYIEIRWEEGVLMNLFIFHFNKAFLSYFKIIWQPIHFTTITAVTSFQDHHPTTFLLSKTK